MTAAKVAIGRILTKRGVPSFRAPIPREEPRGSVAMMNPEPARAPGEPRRALSIIRELEQLPPTVITPPDMLPPTVIRTDGPHWEPPAPKRREEPSHRWLMTVHETEQALAFAARILEIRNHFGLSEWTERDLKAQFPRFWTAHGPAFITAGLNEGALRSVRGRLRFAK